MTLSIIIISYNTARLTVQTLESAVADISRSSILKGRSEILVVDNNSSDSSRQDLKEFARTSSIPVTLIENSENLGFAQANNQAIAQSQGQYLLLLNSDTIVQPDALTTLVSTFQTSDRLGIVAAQLYNQDGSVQPQGGSFPTLLSLATHMLMLDDTPFLGKSLPSTQHTGKRSLPPTTHVTTAEWVGGTAMLIRREVIEEVGALDENIFMYGEDMELCIRAKNHHWNVALQPKSHIVHLGSASSSSANAIVGELKSYLYIWAKHKPLWQLRWARFLIMLGCRLRIFFFGTMNQHQRMLTYKEALKAVRSYL